MKNKRLKLIAATAMTIFNLFVCFSAAFAWFVGAKNLEGSGIGVQMEANELRIEYDIYAYNDELKQVEQVNNFNLLPYDTIIKEKNSITPIVTKITLYSNLFVDETSSNIDVLMHCTETDYAAPSLSNITYFKFGSLNIDSNEASDIYYETIEGLENVDKHTFFTTVKLTTVEYTMTLPIVDDKVILYGIFNYDEDLIDNLGINWEDAPTYTNDIQYIRYSTHE